MDLFFSPDFFSPEENINKLEKKADYLRPFKGISVSRSILKETKNIITILLNNSCAARTVNLLRLLLMGVFDFFESDSYKEIFKYIIHYPDKTINHLSPRISQAFTLLILNIHKSIATFSELVVNFLNFDPTMNYIFSYSTFPAIFGYFTLDYLCELAGEFLIEILKHQNTNAIRRSRSTGNYFWVNISPQNFKDNKVFNFANQMVASFFISMHQFFNCLWTNFRAKIIYQPKDINQLFQFFCDALNNAAFYLTSHHQVVLSTYIAIDRENCVSVIFHDVFAVSLKENFPELFELYNFFIYLGDQPMSEESNQVFTILTKNRKYNPCIPKLPPPNVIQRVPIVMSECDIYIVTEIANRDKRFASDTVEMIQSKDLALKKGYIPFYADIIVPTNEWRNQPAKAETNKRQTKIFFQIPNSNTDVLDENSILNLDENEESEFKRNYLIIQNIASINGIDELDAIKRVIFPDRYSENDYSSLFKKIQNKDPHFASLCLKQYIQNYKETQIQINNLLFLKQWSKSVEIYASLAETTKKSLLYCFANHRIDEVSNLIDPKNRMTVQVRFRKLFETIMNLNTTPQQLIFFSCIKLLNQIMIKPDPALTNLVSRYNNYSKHLLSDSVHHWADENPQVASHLVREVQELRMQFNLKIGERIIALITLSNHLMNLCKEFTSISYQSLFDFIIEEMKPSKVAEIIIVLKVFVIQNKVVTDILDKNEFVHFENLMNSFYKLLRLDADLLKDFLCY